MSASNQSSPSDGQTHSRFSFQHFDQECDFGIENANGERIRKRKKPGRKPNPPSVQERRAQNRAAQRAFREREQQRKEEKEKQWRSYSEEIKRLKKQLAITQYEAKYLKACVLHLTLACLIHRGSVPHIWTESRIIPSNSHGEYKRPVFAPYGKNIVNEAYQTPALLDMILENQCIVDFDKALLRTSQYNVFCTYKSKTGDANTTDESSFESFVSREAIPLNKNSQEPKDNFPKPKRQRTNSSQSSTLGETPSSSNNSHPSPLMQPSTPPNTANSPPMNDHDSQSSSDDASNSNNNNQVLAMHQKPIMGVIFEPPSLRTSDDFVNMPPLQALHILRLQLKLGSILGNLTPAALLPTALQRVIPHDIRIDYIPGASIRDRMIIFQDYYNMDDCFQFLTQNTVFTGGDVRNTRNWVIDADYSLKFWFISHQLVDQSYTDCMEKREADIIAEEFFGDNGNNGSEDVGQAASDISAAAAAAAVNSFVDLNSTQQYHQSVYFREL